MKFKSSLDKYRRGKPAAVTTNTPTVVIESLTNEGDGVAHVDGQAVFVAGTAPGDQVKICMTERHKRWSRATVQELIAAAPTRVDPLCPYFDNCGGCSWQHLAYEEQLNVKHHQLLETLQRIGNLGRVNARNIVPSPTPYHYRNRIRVVADNNAFHFHKLRSKTLTEITECAIAAPEINHYLASPTHPFPPTRTHIELTVSEAGEVSAYPIQSDRSTELGFRQVNSAVSEMLTESVMSLITERLIEPNRAASSLMLMDLYCGHGSWSLRVAERHPDLCVVGVDALADNIRIARQAASAITNVSFTLGRAEKVLTNKEVTYDAVVVDPPRAGLSDTVIEALTRKAPKVLLYVSCHPATLARDSAKLCAGGIMLDYVQAFDMFPQTPHVETLAVFAGA